MASNRSPLGASAFRLRGKREDLLTIGPEHWAGASLSAVLLVLVAIGVLATLLR